MYTEYTTGWQKRGMPYVHAIVWQQYIIEPSQIDTIISAELHNLTSIREIYSIGQKTNGTCEMLNYRPT